MQNDQNEIRGLNSVQDAARTLVARFARCENGATAIEYGLICSLIFLAIVASVQGVASATTAMHTKIGGSL